MRASGRRRGKEEFFCCCEFLARVVEVGERMRASKPHELSSFCFSFGPILGRIEKKEILSTRRRRKRALKARAWGGIAAPRKRNSPLRRARRKEKNRQTVWVLPRGGERGGDAAGSGRRSRSSLHKGHQRHQQQREEGGSSHGERESRRIERRVSCAASSASASPAEALQEKNFSFLFLFFASSST